MTVLPSWDPRWWARPPTLIPSQALSSVPAGARDLTRNAAEQGFLHGLNTILLLGALLSFAGAAFALWLVREQDIERETLVGTDFEGEPEPARA